MTRLLQLSVVLNLILLLAVGWQNRKEAPMNRTPRSPVGLPAGKRSLHQSRTHAAKPQPALPWSKIEASDPRHLMANLRAIGCPEQTIRDIVTLRVTRAYRERFLEQEAELARARDFTRPTSAREWRESSRRQQELRNEMIYTLESALGQDRSMWMSAVLGWPERWREPMAFLDVEKRRQLREFDMRYDELKSDLNRRAYTGRLDAEDAAQLKEIEHQRQRELAATLTPTELEEYLYRESSAADYVRRNLPEAKSESEFRAMVKATAELEMDESPVTRAQRMGIEPGDPEALKAETERKAALDQRLKEMLGEARMAEQQAEEEQRVVQEKKRQEAEAQDRELVRITEMASGVGIAEADAKRFFDRLIELTPTLQPQFEEIEKKLTGTPEEIRRQMEAFAKIELQKIAAETLGEKGPALVDKMIEKNH
jgi:hypothetical protein